MASLKVNSLATLKVFRNDLMNQFTVTYLNVHEQTFVSLALVDLFFNYT